MGDVKKEMHGRNYLPNYTFGMGDVKEEFNHMTKISVDGSSVVSLLGNLDPHWKSQLLVDYSKDLHTCMILDDELHEEGYLVQYRVIYDHDRIFLCRAFQHKHTLLQRAYEEYCFSHTYSMKLNNIIMKSYHWEGFEGGIYQDCQSCMYHVEMEQQHNSVKYSIHPSLSSFERGDRPMHHSICLRRIIGEEHTYVNHILFSNYMYSCTMYM